MPLLREVKSKPVQLIIQRKRIPIHRDEPPATVETIQRFSWRSRGLSRIFGERSSNGRHSHLLYIRPVWPGQRRRQILGPTSTTTLGDDVPTKFLRTRGCVEKSKARKAARTPVQDASLLLAGKKMVKNAVMTHCPRIAHDNYTPLRPSRHPLINQIVPMPGPERVAVGRGFRRVHQFIVRPSRFNVATIRDDAKCTDARVTPLRCVDNETALNREVAQILLPQSPSPFARLTVQSTRYFVALYSWMLLCISFYSPFRWGDGSDASHGNFAGR